MRSTGHFNVAPRFTPGSPALVREEIALRVAAQERDSFPRAKEGIYGETDKAKAERLGLRGIVEYRVERGSGKKHGWEVIDLCTGERLFRLCTEALRTLGWKSYHDLQGYERKIVDENPPSDFEDPTKGWYKLSPEMSSGFPHGWKVQVYRPEVLETGVWPWRALRPESPDAS